MKSTIKFLVLTMLLVFALAAFAGCALHKHTWTEATCTAPKTCTDCGITEGEALGHTEQIVEAQAATCYETGLTEGKVCSVCNEVLVAQKVVLSLGHDMVIDLPQSATCTEAGLTAGAHCSRCDYKEEPTEVPALGHSYMFPCDAHCQVCGELSNENATHTIVAVAAKAATCTATGNVAYWYCSDCGAAWADEALTQLTNQKNVVIPALGHAYMYPCDAHCMVCGELTNPNAAHTIVAVAAKAATCTENGNVAYWTCSDCGGAWLDEALTLVANRMNVIVPATGHIYVGFSCETDGVCACGAIKTAAHTATYVAPVEAITCLDRGHDGYWECTACGACFAGDETEMLYEVNPAWLFYTGECQRPEGAADCANVPCTLCGEETYGYGDHDTGVAACQNGHCSKCDTDIEGYGCANYDTPACEDGFCFYCGGPVEGFGHENGAWAPCQDGECSYGCGLKYSATEDHVDADADDYCDNCWNHLNHDVNPCLGGECSICWTYIEPSHTYMFACDAHCMLCGELTNPNAAHTINFVEGYAATCTANGMADRYECSICGYCWLDEGLTLVANRMNVIVPATGHAYMFACDAHCMNCGELTNENAAHTITAVAAKAATCTENGNVAYWTCSDCGAAWLDEALTLVANRMSVILPATGHAYFYACDAHCMNCYELTNENAAHTIVAVEAKAATCAENGNVAYWTCSDCGGAWLDEALTLVANRMSVVIPALGEHSYTETVVAPTCTAKGYTKHTCDVCGDSYNTDEVEALGHKDENGDYKCDKCSTKMLPEAGTALTIPQALAIAKLQSHNTYTTQKYYITGIVTNVYNTTYGNLYLKDADGNQICIYGLYTYDGSTRYDKMSYKPVEGDELTVYTVLGMYNSTAQGKNAWMDEVVAHEHDYTETVTAPTCTNDGYTTHTCSICQGYYVDSEVEALGHTTENGVCERCELTIGGEVVNNETFTADFNTVANTNTSYTTVKTTAGWTATNAAVFKGGTTNSSPAFKAIGSASDRGFALNGKTSAKGKLVSPTLSGGLSKITFGYTNVFSESNGVDITVTVKDSTGATVATKRLDNNSVTMYTGYTFEWDLAAEGVAVKGDFTIEIVNNSPSNNSKNKDRVCIWNLQWTTNY